MKTTSCIFPSKDLTQSEVANINKKVFEGGQEYEIKKGKIYFKGKPIDRKILKHIFN